MNDSISRQDAIDLWDKYHPFIATKAMEYDMELRALPSAQTQLIEQGAYVRGFEQGRTQGMIDAKEWKK